MPQVIKSTEEIRVYLNSLPGGEEWDEMPGYYALSSAELKDQKITFIGESVALKCFFNKSTGEIRSFVAKFVDERASKELP